MAKKNLTTKQERQKYDRIVKITSVLKYVSMALPYIIISIVNWDKYFVEYSGTKVSIAFIMAMIVLGITLFGAAKKEYKDTEWAVLVRLLILGLIGYLLGSLITDFGLICLCGAAGMLGACILSVISKKYANERDLIKDAITEARKETLKEKAKEENIGNLV